MSKPALSIVWDIRNVLVDLETQLLQVLVDGRKKRKHELLLQLDLALSRVQVVMELLQKLEEELRRAPRVT